MLIKRYLEAAQQAFAQSWQYSDLMLESKYNEARCKLLLGNTDGALDDLETVIKINEDYAVKAAVDSDFEALGEKYGALILKLRTELIQNMLRRFDSYNTLRTRYISFGGDLPHELVPLEAELQRWLDENHNVEASKYVDLRRIYRGIGECSAMISAGLDHVLEKGAEQVKLFGIRDMVVTGYNGPVITNITIPDCVVAIGDRAFYYKSLSSVTIPDGVTAIGEYAFSSNSLAKITIGANVSFSENAFESNFGDSYKSNGKLAGTYERGGYTNGKCIWNYISEEQ